MPLTDLFPSLPKPVGYGKTRFEMNADAALIEYARQVNANKEMSQLRSAGVYVTDLGTKAAEGMESMVGRFSENIPFLKPGALTGTFKEITSAVQTAGSRVEQAFGIKRGAIPGVPNPAADATRTNASAKQLKTVLGPFVDGDMSHLVTLSFKGEVVDFLVLPEVVEQRNVQYEPSAPVQAPGAFQKYKGTDSVQWSVNATFISRTSQEATDNLKRLNTLRAWTMPFFGENTAANPEFANRLGAPPPVLRFKGLRKGIIGEVPVVITSLNWTWPRDVDYIPARDPTAGENGPINVPFPTIMTVGIQLVESFSPREFNQFDLMKYRNGDMLGAFGSRLRSTTGESGGATEPVVPHEEPEQVVITGRMNAYNDPRSLIRDLRRNGDDDPRTTAGAAKAAKEAKAISERRVATVVNTGKKDLREGSWDPREGSWASPHSTTLRNGVEKGFRRP